MAMGISDAVSGGIVEGPDTRIGYKSSLPSFRLLKVPMGLELGSKGSQIWQGSLILKE
jgi:hypothetical protein